MSRLKDFKDLLDENIKTLAFTVETLKVIIKFTVEL